MMNWQTISALSIVALAAAWLVRRVSRIVASGSRDGAGHIGGCGTCAKNPNAADKTPIVQLGTRRDEDDELRSQ